MSIKSPEVEKLVEVLAAKTGESRLADLILELFSPATAETRRKTRRTSILGPSTPRSILLYHLQRRELDAFRRAL